jgi:hypothetical protein
VDAVHAAGADMLDKAAVTMFAGAAAIEHADLDPRRRAKPIIGLGQARR